MFSSCPCQRPRSQSKTLCPTLGQYCLMWYIKLWDHIGLYGRVKHEDMCECFVQCCQSVFMAQRWWTFQISLWCWLDFMVRCSLSFEKWWAAKFGLAFVIFSVSFMLQRTHKPANHTDKWSANYLNMSHNDVVNAICY